MKKGHTCFSMGFLYFHPIVESVLGSSKRSSSISLLDLLKNIPAIPDYAARVILGRVELAIISGDDLEKLKSIHWLSATLTNLSLFDIRNLSRVSILDETLVRPLDSTLKFAEVNFARSLRLKKSEGREHRDVLADSFNVFIRDGFRRVFDVLDAEFESPYKRAVLVEGSQGRGKSSCAALWAFNQVSKGDWLLWIHCGFLGTKVIIANNESVLSSLAWDGSIDKLLDNHCFKLCVLDGVTVANTSNVQKIRAWGSREPQTRLAVVVPSGDQRSEVIFHRRIELDAWEETEFVEALNDHDFRRSVAHIFNRDKDLQLRIRATGIDLNTLSQEDALDTIQKIVREKHLFSGGNAWLMFNFTISEITKTIKEAVRSLPTSTTFSYHKMDCMNLLFAKSHNTWINETSSEIVQKVIAEKASYQNDFLTWLISGSLGQNDKDILFKNLVSQVLMSGQSLLTDQSPSIWGNEGAIEYSSDFLLSKSMTPEARKLFGLVSIPKSSQYFCCPVCEKKFTMLDNLAAHIECHSSEIMALSGEDNLEGNMQILLQDSSPLDCIDLTGKTNVWLPRSRSTPLFDFIRYVSDNEIWFIQVTIAS